MELIRKGYSLLGASFYDLIDRMHSYSAYRQLARQQKRFGGRSNVLFSFLRQFIPRLRTLFSDPLLARAGYQLVYTTGGDAPFSSGVELQEVSAKRGAFFASFNFDFYFNKNKQPSVVLGNFQGHHKKSIDDFRERMGASPLDYFLSRFTRAFQNPSQRVVLNPRFHNYRKPLNLYTVALSMVGAGKISEIDARYFISRDFIERIERHPGDADVINRYFTAQFGIAIPAQEIPAYEKRNKEVALLVKEEMERIPREATGMHKAAFKKAGFRLSKSRFFRTKEHLVVRAQRAAKKLHRRP